jgi:hypothetical protein
LLASKASGIVAVVISIKTVQNRGPGGPPLAETPYISHPSYSATKGVGEEGRGGGGLTAQFIPIVDLCANSFENDSTAMMMRGDREGQKEFLGLLMGNVSCSATVTCVRNDDSYL